MRGCSTRFERFSFSPSIHVFFRFFDFCFFYIKCACLGFRGPVKFRFVEILLKLLKYRATSYFRNLSTNCRRGESVTIVNAYLSIVSFALCRLICRRLNVARLAIVDHFVQRVLSRVSETNFITNFTVSLTVFSQLTHTSPDLWQRHAIVACAREVEPSIPENLFRSDHFDLPLE